MNWDEFTAGYVLQGDTWLRAAPKGQEFTPFLMGLADKAPPGASCVISRRGNYRVFITTPCVLGTDTNTFVYVLSECALHPDIPKRFAGSLHWVAHSRSEPFRVCEAEAPELHLLWHKTEGGGLVANPPPRSLQDALARVVDAPFDRAPFSNGDPKPDVFDVDATYQVAQRVARVYGHQDMYTGIVSIETRQMNYNYDGPPVRVTFSATKFEDRIHADYETVDTSFFPSAGNTSCVRIPPHKHDISVLLNRDSRGEEKCQPSKNPKT